jgi:predicted TIM-barrel fold metal-dependent hydrolase
MPPVIDADTHISESARMWELLDPELYPRRPVMVTVPTDTLYKKCNAFWLIDGAIVPKPAGRGGSILITPSAAAFQAERTDINQAVRDISDVPARLAEMNRLSIDVQVIYPTLFLVYLTDDVALEIGLCRAYNRFLAQVWAQSNERMHWVVVPPLRSVEASIAELRWARDHGAVGVFFRGVERDRTLDDPYFFPIYAEAERLDLPICIHTGSGSPAIAQVFTWERSSAFSQARLLPVMAFHNLVANRIPEQFPNLRIGFIEAAASWVPHVLHALKRGGRLPNGMTGPDLFREYRLYVACEADEDVPYLAQYIGEDNLIIGSDFGHNDPSDEPELVRTLRARDDLSPVLVDKILGENARSFYGLAVAAPAR